MHDFIHQLSSNFALKNLGRLHYFLGVEVTWCANDSIHLSQSKYIHDLLRHTNMLQAKPQPTLMISSILLTVDGSIYPLTIQPFFVLLLVPYNMLLSLVQKYHLLSIRFCNTCTNLS